MTNEFAKGVKEEKNRIAEWMQAQQLDDQQIEAVGQAILSTQDNKGNNVKKIFLGGWGRSGDVAKGFAMRLAQLKFDARYLTEPTVPAMSKGDVFIVVSGGGESLTRPIETALKIGAMVIIVTSFLGSPGARLSDIRLVIPGREEKEEGASLSFFERQLKGIPAFPLGTAFELLAMVVLDSIIAELAVIKKKTNEDLKREHSNVPPV